MNLVQNAPNLRYEIQLEPASLFLTPSIIYRRPLLLILTINGCTAIYSSTGTHHTTTLRMLGTRRLWGLVTKVCINSRQGTSWVHLRAFSVDGCMELARVLPYNGLLVLLWDIAHRGQLTQAEPLTTGLSQRAPIKFLLSGVSVWSVEWISTSGSGVCWSDARPERSVGPRSLTIH